MTIANASEATLSGRTRIHELQYYVASSTEYAAEVNSRSSDTWILTTAKDKGDHIYISAINYDLMLSDIYAQIEEFPAGS